MGWVAMSERDIRRIGVLSEVLADRRTLGIRPVTAVLLD